MTWRIEGVHVEPTDTDAVHLNTRVKVIKDAANALAVEALRTRDQHAVRITALSRLVEELQAENAALRAQFDAARQPATTPHDTEGPDPKPAMRHIEEVRAKENAR